MRFGLQLTNQEGNGQAPLQARCPVLSGPSGKAYGVGAGFLCWFSWAPGSPAGLAWLAVSGTFMPRPNACCTTLGSGGCLAGPIHLCINGDASGFCSNQGRRLCGSPRARVWEVRGASVMPFFGAGGSQCVARCSCRCGALFSVPAGRQAGGEARRWGKGGWRELPGPICRPCCRPRRAGCGRLPPGPASRAAKKTAVPLPMRSTHPPAVAGVQTCLLFDLWAWVRAGSSWPMHHAWRHHLEASIPLEEPLVEGAVPPLAGARANAGPGQALEHLQDERKKLTAEGVRNGSWSISQASSPGGMASSALPHRLCFRLLLHCGRGSLGRDAPEVAWLRGAWEWNREPLLGSLLWRPECWWACSGNIC